MTTSLRIVLRRAAIGSLAAVCFGALLAMGSPAHSEDFATTATGDIPSWIKELDSDIFANREGAAKRLFEAGRAAVEPLAQAANGRSFEQTTAAIGILRRLFHSNDFETKKAAQIALENLAGSSCDSAASLAVDALAPPVEIPAVIYPRPVRPHGFRKLNARMVIAAPVQVAFIVQQTTIANDNGKSIRIDEDQQNGIRMRVTENVKGVATMQTYQAKDADELKQKFPDAHKLYEKAKGMQGAHVITSTRAVAARGAVPIVVPAQNPFQPAAPPPPNPPAAAK